MVKNIFQCSSSNTRALVDWLTDDLLCSQKWLCGLKVLVARARASTHMGGLHVVHNHAHADVRKDIHTGTRTYTQVHNVVLCAMHVGVLRITPEFSLVVVEGCGKAHKRYAKLMLRRIDWSLPPPKQVCVCVCVCLGGKL